MESQPGAHAPRPVSLTDGFPGHTILMTRLAMVAIPDEGFLKARLIPIHGFGTITIMRIERCLSGTAVPGCPVERSSKGRFVSGHGFSRAASRPRKKPASAAAVGNKPGSQLASAQASIRHFHFRSEARLTGKRRLNYPDTRYTHPAGNSRPSDN